jgi:hypothetical protein
MIANPVERLRNRWSEDERANALAALAANGGSCTRGAIARTARELRIPAATLRVWAKGENGPFSAHIRELKKGDLADAFEAVVWQILDVLPSKLAKATASQLTVSLGICLDKMRLLRADRKAEQADQFGHVLTDEEKLAKLNDLLDQVRARQLPQQSAETATSPAATVPADPSSCGDS